MKFTSTWLLAAILATTQAYKLNIFFQSGLEIRVTGDMATPCQDFPQQVNGNLMTRVVYEKGDYTNEFMFWSKKDCQGTLVQRQGAGTHYVDPPVGVGSFKVM